jgi:hypothetical protein
MRRLPMHTAIVVLSILIGFSGVWAESTDTYIKQLKDKDPKIRAKAAFELSCG